MVTEVVLWVHLLVRLVILVLLWEVLMATDLVPLVLLVALSRLEIQKVFQVFWEVLVVIERVLVVLSEGPVATGEVLRFLFVVLCII